MYSGMRMDSVGIIMQPTATAKPPQRPKAELGEGVPAGGGNQEHAKDHDDAEDKGDPHVPEHRDRAARPATSTRGLASAVPWVRKVPTAPASMTG